MKSLAEAYAKEEYSRKYVHFMIEDNLRVIRGEKYKIVKKYLNEWIIEYGLKLRKDIKQ